MRGQHLRMNRIKCRFLKRVGRIAVYTNLLHGITYALSLAMYSHL